MSAREPSLSDRDLRRAWESAADGDGAIAADAAGCPAADRLWAAAHRELGPAETREVVDHVAACPACAEAWRLARHLGADAAAAAPAPAPRAPARNARQWALAAVAAALVAVLGIGFQQLRSPAPAELRGGDGAALRSRVADGAALPRDRFELAWEPVPGAVEYDLRLTTAELAPVASRRGLEEPRYRVPPERLAGLPGGSRLYWQVEAVLEDGGREVSPAWEVAIAGGAEWRPPP